MAQARYYSATAQPTILTSAITPSTTNILVQQTVGFPVNTPYILALDYNNPSEEVVLVTAQTGTSLTVIRAYDGTSATSHSAGAAVRHTWSAIDGTDARVHEGNTANVHGVLGNVVGDTDVQTLSNKTLFNTTFTGTVNLTSPNITGTVTGGATYAAPTLRDATVVNSAVGIQPFKINTIAGTTAIPFLVQNNAQTLISTTSNGQSLFVVLDVASTPLIARGITGQTASLFRVQSVAGTDVVNVQAAGQLRALQGMAAGATQQAAWDASGNLTATATQVQTAPTAASIPITAKGAASQTGNLTEWRNSANTLLSNIDSAGVPHFLGGMQAGTTNQFQVDNQGNLVAATNFTLGAFNTYAVSWTGATTNPSIGNGTLTGRYCIQGKKVFVEIRIASGSTTTYGSGTWSFSLPVNASTYYSSSTLGNVVGVSMADRAAGASATVGMVWCNSQTVVRASSGTTSQFWDSATPWTPAATYNQYNLSFTYEAA